MKILFSKMSAAFTSERKSIRRGKCKSVYKRSLKLNKLQAAKIYALLLSHLVIGCTRVALAKIAIASMRKNFFPSKFSSLLRYVYGLCSRYMKRWKNYILFYQEIVIVLSEIKHFVRYYKYIFLLSLN